MKVRVPALAAGATLVALLACHQALRAGSSESADGMNQGVECAGLSGETKWGADVDAGLRALEGAYRACGDGKGVLLQGARWLQSLGESELAARYLEREVTHPHPSRSAYMLIEKSLDGLPEARREAFRKLGDTVAEPLVVLDVVVLDRWIRGVVCRDERMVGIRTREVAGLKGMRRVDVECPELEHRHLFALDEGFEKLTGPIPDGGFPSDANALTRLMPKLLRFGIRTPDQLRRALVTWSDSSRSGAWLLSWVKDAPTAVVAWRSVLMETPHDLEATAQLAQYLVRLGRDEEALATLSSLDPKKAVLEDTRGLQAQQSAIPSARCDILLRQGKVEAATKACLEALDLGSKHHAERLMGEIEYLGGSFASALTRTTLCLDNGGPKALCWHLRGLILERLGRHAEAVDAWNRALKAAAYYWPARRALGVGVGTPEENLAQMRQEAKEEHANYLAKCLEFYLELGLEERAQACAEAADAADPGRALFTRLIVQFGSDPAGALDAAQSDAEKRPSKWTLAALVRLYARAGRTLEAQSALMRLRQLSPWTPYLREDATLGHADGEGAEREDGGVEAEDAP